MANPELALKGVICSDVVETIEFFGNVAHSLVVNL